MSVSFLIHRWPATILQTWRRTNCVKADGNLKNILGFFPVLTLISSSNNLLLREGRCVYAPAQLAGKADEGNAISSCICPKNTWRLCTLQSVRSLIATGTCKQGNNLLQRTQQQSRWNLASCKNFAYRAIRRRNDRFVNFPHKCLCSTLNSLQYKTSVGENYSRLHLSWPTCNITHAIFAPHGPTMSNLDFQPFDLFGEFDALRVGQRFPLIVDISDVQNFAHELDDWLSFVKCRRRNWKS